jgi:two-component system NtrC family sensor kinase
VLKVISRSAFNLQSVLDTLVESAARLCEAEIANIWRPAGATYRLAASYGVASLTKDWLAYKEYLAGVTYEPGRGSCVGRTLLEGRVVQIDDVRADREYDQRGALASVRTMLGVPLLRDGNAIGVMILVRATVRPFTAKQIELIETFADQAVIAIENTRLFEEVQTRTRELQGSLEYQTATSEILNVISKSPTDVQPVFQAIAHSAARLCDAKFCHVFRFDDEHLHFAAEHGLSVEGAEAIRCLPPLPPSRRSGVTRSILSGTVEEIPNVLADPEYQAGAIAKIIDYRSLVAVPMLNEDGRPVGAIAVARTQTGHFAQRHIELLKTFADQDRRIVRRCLAARFLTGQTFKLKTR